MTNVRRLSTSVTVDGVHVGCVLHVNEDGPYMLWPIHDKAPMLKEYSNLATAVQALVAHSKQ